MLDLDRAMKALGRRHARQEKVAELRMFAGLTFEEIAMEIDKTERTARQDWAVARAWLARRLENDASAARQDARR
jgi:DNA-directed RNA polymerase specialized sigma24 family protein